MDKEIYDILVRLLVAMIAGGLIGFERIYYGRPAGVRTHTLVCMASSLLMLVTIYQRQWFPDAMIETVRVDPTRMAQGIMTGIGFLGAGVIMKEGISVRGLTTAASIWITAAIGILAGIGFYSALLLVSILTLGTLTIYRMMEKRIPVLLYINNTVRFHRDATISEPELRDLITSHGFGISNVSYALTDDGKYFEYNLVIKTRQWENTHRLCQTLASHNLVVEFRISPTGD